MSYETAPSATSLAPHAPLQGGYRSRVRHWLRRWAILRAGEPLPLRRPTDAPKAQAQAQTQAQPKPQPAQAPPRPRLESPQAAPRSPAQKKPAAPKKPLAWPPAAWRKRLRTLLDTDLSELRLTTAQLACVCAAIFAVILLVGLVLPVDR